MAYIETKDPFGFVGSHVVRRQPRRKGGEEHGWLTRYDEALDCYTLFVPGGGEPRLLARGEVMKFLSAPNIELHDDDQADFPPPVKDTTTSRYLGVKLRRPVQGDSTGKAVRGQVTCFLPFGDRYCVEYEDGATEEVSESAVIDGMIALIQSPVLSPPSPRKARNGSVRTRSSIEILDEDELPPARRKRRRVEPSSSARVQEIPPGSVAVVENLADEEKKEDDDEEEDDEVVIVGPAELHARPSTDQETAPNILEIMSSTLGSATRANALETASHPEEELQHVGEGEVADQDDDAAESHDLGDEPLAETPPADPAQTAKKEVPFYIIEKQPHEAVEPLPKRAMAFELLRASLLNLLDRREATAVKIAMQYDILRNTDVRDRDAVIRFMAADGLIVLNHLLNAYATDVLEDEDDETKEESDSMGKVRERMERDDQVLHVLKIVAMLPTPKRAQVIDSNIGKTINYLSKVRGPPGRQSPLPKCITGLAKWVKSAWIKNIPSASQTPKTPAHTRQPASRPQQQARRGGHGGPPGRSSRPRSQRPQQQTSSAPRGSQERQPSGDNTLISRLSQQRQPPPPAAAAASRQPPAPRRATGGLKPDWMRQKEDLARSRLCIADNTNVDTRLYRDSRTRPVPTTNVPAVVSFSQASAPQDQPDQRSDQHEEAGGPDGVFGRRQRLHFGKRWSRQEFRTKDPPGVLTQPPGSYSMPSYGRQQYSDQASVPVRPVPHSSRRPRSILRRVSRYNDEPAIEGTGT
jgi:hypothetical protein